MGEHVPCMSGWRWAQKGRWARLFEGGLRGSGNEREDGGDESGA